MNYIKEFEFESTYSMKSKQYMPEHWSRWEKHGNISKLMIYNHEVENSTHQGAIYICEPLSLSEIRKMKLKKLSDQ